MLSYYELEYSGIGGKKRMNAIEIIGGVLIMIAAVVITVTVMFQEGKGNGLNALAGSIESSYLGKNKNRSMQATMVRVTKYTGIAFVVITLAVYLISYAMK